VYATINCTWIIISVFYMAIYLENNFKIVLENFIGFENDPCENQNEALILSVVFYEV